MDPDPHTQDWHLWLKCRVQWLVGSCPAGPFTRALTAHAREHPSELHSPQGVDEVELWELVQMEDSRSKTRDQEMGLLMIRGGCQVVKVPFFVQEVPGLTDRAQGRMGGRGEGRSGSAPSPRSLGHGDRGSQVCPVWQAAASPPLPSSMPASPGGALCM